MSSNQTYLDQTTPVGLHPAFRFLVIVAVAVLTPALVVSAVLTVGRIRLDHHIAAIRASGEPTTAQELAKKFPPIAEERNAAIPLIKACASLYQAGAKSETRVPPSGFEQRARQALEEPTEGKRKEDRNAEDIRKGIQPETPLVEKHLAVLSHRYVDFFKPLDPQYKEFAKAILPQYPECLALLHDAAQRPECRFPVDQIELSIHQPLILLASKIALEAEEGQVDVLYQDVMDLTKIGELLIQDPVLPYSPDWGFKCGYFFEGIRVKTLGFVLPKRLLRADQLKNLDEAMKELDVPDFCYKGLIGTRYSFIEGASRSRLGISGMYECRNGFVLWNNAINFNWDSASLYDNPLRVAIILGRFNEQIAVAQQAPAERKPAHEKETDELYKIIPWVPGLDDYSYRSWSLMRKSNFACTKTAIALYRYHLDKNAWPAALNELVPQYLAAIPLDPYSPSGTTPVRYVNGPSGVRVYSVGRDGIDNGGWSSWDKTIETESANTSSRRASSDTDNAFILQPPAK